jgi:hypothetical protein
MTGGDLKGARRDPCHTASRPTGGLVRGGNPFKPHQEHAAIAQMTTSLYQIVKLTHRSENSLRCGTKFHKTNAASITKIDIVVRGGPQYRMKHEKASVLRRQLKGSIFSITYTKWILSAQSLPRIQKAFRFFPLSPMLGLPCRLRSRQLGAE